MNVSTMAVFALMTMMLSATTVISYMPAFAQTEVGVGAEVKIKDSGENKNQDTDKSKTETETHSVTEIMVMVAEGKASVKITTDGNTNAYILDTDNKTEIIASIQSETGLSEAEIEAMWDYDIRSHPSSDDKTKGEISVSAKASAGINSEANPNPNKKAIEIIAELKQRLMQLEQRFQTLLIKLESGAYFGNTLDEQDAPKYYTITLDGSVSAVSDVSSESEYSGEIFLESIVARDNQSKFKVTGGHVTIDGETYEVLFGKTRSSLGFSGAKDTMVSYVNY